MVRLCGNTGPESQGFIGPRGLRPSEVLLVTTSDGTAIEPHKYQLRNRGHRGYDGRVLYFSEPVMTAGMTILFEGRIVEQARG